MCVCFGLHFERITRVRVKQRGKRERQRAIEANFNIQKYSKLKFTVYILCHSAKRLLSFHFPIAFHCTKYVCIDSTE